MTDPTSLTLAQARDLLRAKGISAVELADAHLAAIEKARDLNAFVLETPDQARQMAKHADEKLARQEGGALAGIPLGIKDLFATDGTRTTACSHILVAMGSSNETSWFGPVVSPWRRKGAATRLVPGGSSGGSAAAVAANLCLGATGTDTGGSIRQPAAFAGIVGLKPTYGRCSRWGIVAFASSLDQAGPMTRTVRDAAILLKHMASVDPLDSTSVDIPVPDYEAGLESGVKGLRVGIPKEYRIDGAPPEIEALWEKGAEWLKAQGAQIVEVSLPHTKYALPTYYIVAPAEASSNLARYDGVRYGHRALAPKDITDLYERSRAEGFGKEVQRRILIGTYVLSSGYYDAYYARAQKIRTLIARDFTQAYEKCDVLLTPATPGPAFGVGEKTADPVSMYLNDIFTVTVNLAGLPGISVPAGLTANGLPLGLQLIGKAFDEATILRAARAIEIASGFDAKPTPWWRAA